MTKESAAISPATLPATVANTVRRVGVGLRARGNHFQQLLYRSHLPIYRATYSQVSFS